jgi:predicted kinase
VDELREALVLVQVCGLPGSGKTTLSVAIADVRPVVLLRIDAIDAALRRNGLTPQQTGVATYSVAHAIAAPHLQRGLTVVADAVSAVDAARRGWVGTAAAAGAPLRVVEVVCPDPVEHRRRVEERRSDLDGFEVPDWAWVQAAAAEYEPRTDERLVVDSTQDLQTCVHQVLAYLEADRAPTTARS